jgi:choline kinase
MPTTADAPKCFAEVKGRRIIDWTRQAFADNGIERLCFIGGYRIDTVKAAYPDFIFYHNEDWENNNILASLMYAQVEMDEPFICCYSDTLFTPRVVAGLIASEADIALSVDTDWLARYQHRSQHPPDDAEKVTSRNGAITAIHRDLPESEAHGEFTGMARFSARGASQLRDHYHRCREACGVGPFRESPAFSKAYLIHLLQDMIESGVAMAHVDTPGSYMEIDTQEDFELAQRFWR